MSNVKDTVIEKIKQSVNYVGSIDPNTKFGILIVILIIIVIICVIRICYILKWKKGKQCNTIGQIYTFNKNIKEIDNTNTLWNKAVNYYYIKTSYNSCSIGSYVDDYVDTCILYGIIGQGVRCFDFEIFIPKTYNKILTETII